MNEYNLHIEEYLDYYLSLDISPEFAVLLRGKWGSGKSWFIKNLLRQKYTDQYLYVSLYGITSYSEIEDSFFQQLHPILSSKGMKIAGTILKGLLKTTIKIDLDAVKKEEASISTSVPDINFPDYLRNLDGKILVFDDLERCSVPISNMLGYINQFVETNGLKVILIANEEEIIDQTKDIQDNPKKYLTIKEKLIGKSFDVQIDFSSAMNFFIDGVKTDNCKDLLRGKESLLKELFINANYDNLRHLRQAILDFDRFYSFLPEIDKDDLWEHIIKLFFAITFEIKKGALKESEIVSLFSVDTKENNIQKIGDKYAVFGMYFHPIDGNVWRRFFKDGFVDKETLSESIKNSIYFEEDNTPNWIKLWYFFTLEDDKFDDIFSKTYQDFENLVVLNKYVVLQIAGIFFELSKNNLITKSEEDVFNIAKNNIDNLKLNGTLKTKNNEIQFPGDKSHGLQYRSLGNKLFQKLLQYASEEAKQAALDDLPREGTDLSSLLKTSIDQFIEKIILNNSENSIYYDKPILTFVPARDFVDAIVNLPNKEKRKAEIIFEKRYDDYDFKLKLKDEVPWLKEVLKILEEEKNRLIGKPSGFIIEDSYVRLVTNCIKNLEQI